MTWRIVLTIFLLDILSRGDASECGGGLVATTSVTNLTLPTYPIDLSCTWSIIPSQPNMDVRIVAIVNLRESDAYLHCSNDHLKIYKGSESVRHLVATMCGNMNQTVQVNGNANITVKVKRDFWGTYPGKAHLQFYQTRDPVICQNTFESSRQEHYAYLTGIPNGLSRSRTCTSIFKNQNDDVHHILQFMAGRADYSDCDENYFEIYNGDSDRTTLIGKYSGHANRLFFGSGALFVKHVSACRIPGGINIKHYTTNNGVAQNIYIGTVDHLDYVTSPDFPYFLPRSLIYTVTVSYAYNGFTILVNFTKMDVASDNNCSASQVVVYDQNYVQYSRRLGALCGSQTGTFQSTRRYILVQMITLYTVRGTGFNMTYKAIEQGRTTTNSPGVCNSSLLTATSSWSYLSSPGYPYQYSSNMDCTWIIKAFYHSMMVRIEVIDSALEYSSSCDFDSMTAYDGGLTDKILKVWCGRTMPTVQSTGYRMALKLHTNWATNLSGFRLKYSQTSDSPPCGGSLYANSDPQVLTSPGYPHRLYPHMSCTWIIDAPLFNIKIDVIDSSMAGNRGCNKDYVEVYDGSYTDGRSLGKFCGTLRPLYISTDTSVTIIFHTHMTLPSYRGFNLTYVETLFIPGPTTKKKNNAGAIAGGVLSGISILIFIIVTTVRCVARKQPTTRITSNQSFPRMTYRNSNTASTAFTSSTGLDGYTTSTSQISTQYQPQMNPDDPPAYSTLSPQNSDDKTAPPPAYDTLDFQSPRSTRPDAEMSSGVYI